MIRCEKLKRRAGWVILGLPWIDCRWCGVYRTRAEAEEDRRGLVRCIKSEFPELVEAVRAEE